MKILSVPWDKTFLKSGKKLLNYAFQMVFHQCDFFLASGEVLKRVYVWTAEISPPVALIDYKDPQFPLW